jgi:hypothetical protein
MNALPSSVRAIEVHIEELILHGFEPGMRWNVAEALESELRGLLAKEGIPQPWQANPQRIDAGAVRAHVQSRPAVAGAEIARAIYRGGGQ